MRNKAAPLQIRIGNFDSRFGWSRRIQASGRYPEYTIWRIHKGKRYTTYCFLLSSDRKTIADELWSRRRYLQYAINEAEGKESSNWPQSIERVIAIEKVKISRYIKNQVEREEEHVGPKSDQYFSKYVGRIVIGLINSGVDKSSIERIMKTKKRVIRKSCERLVDTREIINEILKSEKKSEAQ